MTSVIILVYGEGRHLVPKPADYATLIDVVRAKFRDLDKVENDRITFHFTPEWFDAEVELDRDVFAEVHNRAVLRVTTTASASAPPRDSDIREKNDHVIAMSPGTWAPPGSLCLWIIHVPSDRKFLYAVKPHEKLGELMVRAEVESMILGYEPDETFFCFGGRKLKADDTPKDLNMEHGDMIEMKIG